MAPPLRPDQEQKLKNLFYFGNFFGRNRLFQLLKKEEDNDISRRQVMDWLSKQEIAQTFRRPLRRIGVRAIVATKLGQFQCDLLDMSASAYRGHVAIFGMIDVFSKKLYAMPLHGQKLQGLYARWQLLLIPDVRQALARRRPVEQIEEPEQEEEEEQQVQQPRRSGRANREYEVQYILDRRTVRRGKKRITQYLVKWSGFSEQESTWEPKSNLRNAQSLIDEFEASRL